MSHRLTERERQIAELLLTGMQDKEIVEVVGIATQNVKQCLHGMRLKLLRGDWGNVRIRLALEIHRRRHELGVRCQACGEL